MSKFPVPADIARGIASLPPPSQFRVRKKLLGTPQHTSETFLHSATRSRLISLPHSAFDRVSNKTISRRLSFGIPGIQNFAVSHLASKKIISRELAKWLKATFGLQVLQIVVFRERCCCSHLDVWTTTTRASSEVASLRTWYDGLFGLVHELGKHEITTSTVFPGIRNQLHLNLFTINTRICRSCAFNKIPITICV